MFTIAFHGGPRDGERETYDEHRGEVLVTLEDGRLGRYLPSGGSREINGELLHSYNFEPPAQ